MTLDRDDIEAIARRVAELVAEPARLERKMTTAQVADLLNVSTDYVREHAADMRAVRIGNGRNGELRFDRRDVDRFVDGQRMQRPAQPRPRRTPGRARGAAHVPDRVADW